MIVTAPATRQPTSIDSMIERARRVQRRWQEMDQATIDKVVRGLGKTVADHAEELARMTVEETGVGNYEYNLKQDRRKAAIIWHSLKGQPSRGIVRRDKTTGLVEIAKPIGVVGAVLPLTIPVTNFMSNAMFSLKARNAVIAAPHPKARRTVARTAELFHAVLQAHGVECELIQALAEPSIEATRELMGKVDVIVATGGMPMVKSAYSSGKPAYGVGPGNVQTIIDRGYDIQKAVDQIVEGRVFNNGLPCACEQAVFVPEEQSDQIREAFVNAGAAWVDDDATVMRVQGVLYVDDNLSREALGLTAPEVARLAGFEVPEATKILLVKATMGERHRNLRREKLCPVTLFFTYSKFEDAVAMACENIELDGKGHSVSIHSNDEEHIEKFALAANVSRVIVNSCATTSAGGSFLNGFGATTTLGTGFWGNNILNENLSYRHLMNYTRIGYEPEGARIPSDEEIWGE